MYPQGPPQMFQPPTNNMSRTFDHSSFNQGTYNSNVVTNVAHQQIQEVSGTVRSETPQPIQKAPIPEEHIHMKTVLDELRNQCSYAANNPVSIFSRQIVIVYTKLKSKNGLHHEKKSFVWIRSNK